MKEETEILIREIASKHGVLLGQDDPILILQTMNAKLMEENTKAQSSLLNQYKSNLEEIVKRWDYETNNKSERILNASLLAAKETMQLILEESTQSLTLVIQKELEGTLNTINHKLQQNKKTGWYNLAASTLTALSVLVLLFIIFH